MEEEKLSRILVDEEELARPTWWGQHFKEWAWNSLLCYVALEAAWQGWLERPLLLGEGEEREAKL